MKNLGVEWRKNPSLLVRAMTMRELKNYLAKYIKVLLTTCLSSWQRIPCTNHLMNQAHSSHMECLIFSQAPHYKASRFSLWTFCGMFEAWDQHGLLFGDKACNVQHQSKESGDTYHKHVERQTVACRIWCYLLVLGVEHGVSSHGSSYMRQTSYCR
jgi:hypothetical protein